MGTCIYRWNHHKSCQKNECHPERRLFAQANIRSRMPALSELPKGDESNGDLHLPLEPSQIVPKKRMSS